MLENSLIPQAQLLVIGQIMHFNINVSKWNEPGLLRGYTQYNVRRRRIIFPFCFQLFGIKLLVKRLW